MHEDYQKYKQKQIKGKKPDGYVFCQDSEKRRHQKDPHVGKCHLDADDRLRILFPEIAGSGMDDTRIDGSTAKPDENKSCKGQPGSGQRSGSLRSSHAALSWPSP